MSTVTDTEQPSESTPAPSPEPASRRDPLVFVREHYVVVGVVLVVALWILVSIIWQDEDTLALSAADSVGVQEWLQERVVDFQRSESAFKDAVNGIADGIDAVIQWVQLRLSHAAFPRPYPTIGFLGVTAICWFITAVVAGWRMSVLTLACFVSFGILGFYDDSVDLLIVTLLAVGVSVAVGIPLAIAMAKSSATRAILTPVLDVMQTFPPFAYLLPMMLLFGIGAASGFVCTLIFAIPPVIRIASHGLSNVNAATIEATNSMGQTGWQRLRKVELPLAKRTIIVGINQTTMAALSMATIAAFINGPGLGVPVVQALSAVRVGDAFVPALCIVLMAIMLDRITTAASEHQEKLIRSGGGTTGERRGQLLMGGAILTVVCVYLSHNYTWAAKAPPGDFGDWLADRVQAIADWITENLVDTTSAISDWFSNVVLNNLEYVVAGSPWYLTGLAILAIAVLLGGWRAGVATVVCLAGIRWMELWNNSMITLTTTLVATVLVMVLAVIFGVWMGRSKRTDQILRPLLDAGQTIPPFVYLIPVLALFGATRFTAIIAAVVYAAPAAIKIVADGIKNVSAATVEAAESAGAVAIQIITKVQIPMARSSFIVAANQGLLYVLSMVVIGGLVGAGALGYDVVAGFKQYDLRGRGLAAAACIVLLGVMLDRITRYAAQRNERKVERS